MGNLISKQKASNSVYLKTKNIGVSLVRALLSITIPAIPGGKHLYKINDKNKLKTSMYMLL